MTEEEFRKTVLDGVGGIRSDIDAVKARSNELETRNSELTSEMKKITEQLVAAQKQVQARSRTFQPARRGQVSVDCARHIGAVAYCLALKAGTFEDASKRSFAESQAKDILGDAEFRAALTTSEIPLPTEFQGDVVELVSQYGTARQYGTVFPLGAGTVKLPYLSTDTTFTLIASSGTVTEKAPAVTFVSFAAEKFGGLIRMPSEIDEDSVVAMGQFLARYAARNIARAEDHNFWASTGAGSGVNGSVEGLTVSTITNSKTFQAGSGDLSPSDFVIADYRAVRGVVDAAALQNACYFMHPSFEYALSALNTSGNRPYNPNAQIQGMGANPITSGPTLDGFPIKWVDVMPAYTTGDSADTVYVLFGDPSYQYLGVRGGVRFATSQEAGFTTDEILVRALERFTIGLMATGSMAGLETASS